MRHRWRKDLTGMVFHRLTVLEEAPIGANWKVRWKCRCECGTELITRAEQLTAGHTRSCGCLQKEAARRSGKLGTKGPGVYAFNTLLTRYKKSAAIRGFNWELSEEEFRALTSKDCFYCGSEPTAFIVKSSVYLYNGIDRINNNIGYQLSNVISCCKYCNYGKRDLTIAEFVARSAKIANRKEEILSVLS